ncbi:MAG: ATP-binding cassette domain-containing protein [Clostridiales bacterium]|nr:ATP-binding cassette domain-containing protein [Clostridiales bacterium]
MLAVKDLSFSYAGSDSAALSGVSFSVERGDFLAVCGATGSGKSTLLRLIKRELAPRGKAEGEILFCGKPLCELDDRKAAQKIGYVAQRPEEQIVTDRVWHELAFGLENLGLPTGVIRRRVAETACFFGIEEWFDKSTDELSGGQKQLLSLASVMVMQPELLLLDEPTARLDPIAAGDFINAVARLNRELSLTVIMISHCLEDVLPVANRVLALEGGRVAEYGETRKAVGKIKNIPSLAGALPAAARLYSRLGADCECPLTVREGRDLIEHNFGSSVRALPPEEYVHSKNVALEFSGVYFRYSREQEDVLRGLELKVYENEIFCLLGGNGSGKSTALAAAAGLIKPYAGNIRVFGKKVTDREFARAGLLTLLPQDVQTVFLKSTVRAELADANVTEGALTQELDRLMDRHPYDLSGGQQQLLALAKALAARPRLLLLDEPTRGLDAGAKAEFVSVLRKLRDGGMTVVLVTHDAELAAEISDRCALFFRGEIVADDVPRRFFSGNSFYTTAANRICRGYYDLVATVDDAARICLANGKKVGGE